LELTPGNLTYKKIFLFWIPLAATWIMMSVEGPFLAALVARMAHPEYNLAAYGVAFSFALIIEAPVILLMSASTSLVRGKYSFYKLRNFTYSLNSIVTILMLVITIPSIFYFIAMTLINLPEEVARLTHIAIIILIPWPGAIGYRRFYQGILIRNNLTKRVAFGTIVRISSMSLTALILFIFFKVDGVVIAASALSVAVICEAVASKIMAYKIVTRIKDGENEAGESSDLTYKKIFTFYYPLALTSILTLGVQPMVTFFIGQSRMPIESLAVLPVIVFFVFIFRSFGMSFQEVGIALLGKNMEGFQALRKFVTITGSIVVIALGIIALTPLSEIWFHYVSGLSPELTKLAHLPLIILILIPGTSFLLSFQTAVLVEAKNTKPISFATGIEFTMIIIVLLVSIKYFSAVGVIAAALAFIIGRLASNGYLLGPMLKEIRKSRVLE
jgi:Na+-driven multidrug efflux pump